MSIRQYNAVAQPYIGLGHDGTDLPNPTTGEWTADYVRRLQFNASERQYEAIADAHNAAINTDREKLIGYRIAVRNEIENECRGTIQQLREQLAAEREAWQQAFEAAEAKIGKP